MEQRLADILDIEVTKLRMLTFAESTRRTYGSQLGLFLKFCSYLNINPVPISTKDLGRYVAFLSQKLGFSSIRQYLNVVRLLHMESGHPNPLANNWFLDSVLKGLKRQKGDKVSQKLPITADILSGILQLLDFNKHFDVTFWAVCLVGFFSFFRKSNLLVPSLTKFDPNKHLCCSDVSFSMSGAILSVRWSKTIQFRQRILEVPLPHIPGSPYCPSSALLLATSFLPPAQAPRPLFCYRSTLGLRPLTHSEFVKALRKCIDRLGIDSHQYSSHSLRRGGASFALNCGLPSELIKMQGDWASNAYEKYLNPSLNLRRKVAETMGKAFHVSSHK